MHMRLGAAFALLAVLAAGPRLAQAVDPQFVTVGSGGVTGVYYPAAGAICQFVNKGRKTHGVRCSVQSTGGSIENLESVRTGKLELGLAQSDWQHHAFRGTGRFADRDPFEELRSLFSLYVEPFTVVARADAGVRSFADLRGKRVNVGNPGSGQRATMDVVLEALGWTAGDFAEATELRPAEQAAALCTGRIDVMVFTAGHPNGSVREALAACESVVVEVSGEAIDALVARHPYYRHTAIPAGTYPGGTGEVRTFGVLATLVASTRLPAATAETVVRAVFENLDALRRLHPAFATLDRETMARDGLSAPLHEGALRYFREVGLH